MTRHFSFLAKSFFCFLLLSVLASASWAEKERDSGRSHSNGGSRQGGRSGGGHSGSGGGRTSGPRVAPAPATGGRRATPPYVSPAPSHGSRTVARPVYRPREPRVEYRYNNYYRGGYSYRAWAPRYTPYHPHFYSYCYTPWPRPVYYSWYWADSSWAFTYGYYYRPFPYYYGPSYWMTDYVLADLIAENARLRRELREEREDDLRYRSASSSSPVINDEIKEQIRVQVEESLRAHEKRQAVPMSSVLRDQKHIFAVSHELNATKQAFGADDGVCSLTEGDLVKLAEIPSEQSPTALMTVVTSKRESCAAGSRVLISISDLHEFENQFNTRLEEGMKKMDTEFVGKQ